MFRLATLLLCFTILVVQQNHSYAGRAPDQSPDLPDGVSAEKTSSRAPLFLFKPLITPYVYMILHHDGAFHNLIFV